MNIRILLGITLLAFAFFQSGQANARPASDLNASPPYNDNVGSTPLNASPRSVRQ